MKYLKSDITLWFVFMAFISLACGIGYRLPRISFRPGGKPDPQGSSLENGEKIYFTATNEAGDRIDYRGGPAFGGMMMGSYLTCVACHGLDGRGGTHLMHMQVMESPDIRYEALSSEAGEHAENDNHGEEGEYTLEDFRRAVIDGQHPNGEPLSRDMPRWEMNDEDLEDLFGFLESLP